MKILELSAVEAGKLIKEKQVGVVELTKAQLAKIKETEPKIGAYITVCEEEALSRAEAVQAQIDAGELTSPLAGVPMAIKDNICTKGVLTTCASKMLYNFKPVYNSFAYEKLLSAGGVMVGKANMDEFAMGSTTQTSYFQVTKNPWNTEHVPGGSSGGSAAAVAADEAFFALGSDTGGSIRQPASFCGVPGLKPTYGLVSRFGLVAYGSSLDQIGPFGKTVEDLAAVLNEIVAYDKKDSTSVNYQKPDYASFVKNDVKGMKIGLPKEYLGDGLDADVKAEILKAAKLFEDMGAHVEEFSLPLVDATIPAYYIIASAEASSNLSRYDGVKYGYRPEKFEDLNDMYVKARSEGFGTEVKRRIILGAFALSSGYYDAYYKKALQVKALIKQGFDDAFEKYDLVIGPTAPTTALKIGANMDDPLKMYLGDIYTVAANLCGLPGLVVPCGVDSAGLPVGLQLLGKHFDEGTLIQAGYSFEQNAGFEKYKTALREGK